MIALRAAAAFALLFATLTVVQTLRLHSTQAELSAVRLESERQARLDSDAVALAQAEVRDLERHHTAAMSAIDFNHEWELTNAQQAADRTVADLRSGALKLRQHLAATSCSAVIVPGAVASSGVGNEGAGLRPADAGFLVGLADRCDADIRAAQAVIAEDRRLFGPQLPKEQ